MGTECEVLALNCLVMVYIDRCPLTALVPRFLKRCFFPVDFIKHLRCMGKLCVDLCSSTARLSQG